MSHPSSQKCDACTVGFEISILKRNVFSFR